VPDQPTDQLGYHNRLFLLELSDTSSSLPLYALGAVKSADYRVFAWRSDSQRLLPYTWSIAMKIAVGPS
jgi:hypothetical protein